MEANEQAPEQTPETQETPEPQTMGTFGKEEQGRLAPAPATGPQNFADEPAGKPWEKIDRFTMVLAVLMVAGAASVYLLKKNCGPARASASEIKTQTKVEKALDGIRQIDPRAVARTEALVASFYYEPSRRQVESKAFEQNPFLLRLDASLAAKIKDKDPGANGDSSNVVSDETPDAASPDTAAASKAKALATAVGKLDGLKLQSTMVRPQGKSTALISDFVLSTGDTIQGWKIRKIQPDRVTLQWQEFTHTLRMPQ
jgi:hypothetical protein